MAHRGPQWAAWVDALPATVRLLGERWRLSPDGGPTHGHCSLVLPVRMAEGTAAVLKVGFRDEESEHEHLALQRWGGDGAVRLLSADPHHRGLLLERLGSDDLTAVSERWVIVRMMHNAMWALWDGSQCDQGWLTRCVAVAKAVGD